MIENRLVLAPHGNVLFSNWTFPAVPNDGLLSSSLDDPSQEHLTQAVAAAVAGADTRDATAVAQVSSLRPGLECEISTIIKTLTKRCTYTRCSLINLVPIKE